MVTNFGKFCRKLRIDNGELLYDMAQKLGVSSAFLSKVENGGKKPPKNWEETITQLYKLDVQRTQELHDSFFEALNQDSIDLSLFDEKNRNTMLSFARRLNNNDPEIEAIRRLIDRG